MTKVFVEQPLALPGSAKYIYIYFLFFLLTWPGEHYFGGEFVITLVNVKTKICHLKFRNKKGIIKKYPLRSPQAKDPIPSCWKFGNNWLRTCPSPAQESIEKWEIKSYSCVIANKLKILLVHNVHWIALQCSAVQGTVLYRTTLHCTAIYGTINS